MENQATGVIVLVYPLQLRAKPSDALIRVLEQDYEVLRVDSPRRISLEEHQQLLKDALREAGKRKLPIHIIACSMGALVVNRLLQEYELPIASLTYISPLFDWHNSKQLGGVKQVFASAFDRFRPDAPLGTLPFGQNSEDTARLGELTYAQYREIEEEIVLHDEERKKLPRVNLACFYAPDDQFADVKFTLEICRKMGGDQIYLQRLHGFPHFSFERLNTRFAEKLLLFLKMIEE
ncbi:alpha/beta hydrolase [Exiguobacterium sp. s193]|uniref:alpha/beta hydrolase n=1 Tax=Exiguobacterium sp. s193 TaxID=2751207 RepID=UPI001BEB83D0|nr:alpha/beta hydrolase [Exiguobacterium sp. s193]